MKDHFKDHINNMIRYQTSVGRDLDEGLRLDRNERVSNLSEETLADIFKQFKTYSLSASPEARPLYEKIAKSIGLPIEQVYVTCGITEGIRIVYELLTNPGDNVIVLDPTYPMYDVYSKAYQLDYRKFTFGDDLLPDMNSLYDQMDEKTKLVVIPNPNLPIESVFTVEDIRKMADRCRENGTILIVDEAYHFFGALSVLDLLKEYDNLIVMRTFSKAYGLAAIRLGFMVSTAENIEYLSKTRSLVESNTFSMGIAEYFLDHPQLRDEHVKEVRGGAQYMQDELTSLGLSWYGGNVTNGILIFLDNPQDSKEVVAFLKEKKIYIRGSFEAPFDSCIRVSIGPKEIMEQFIQTFKEWLKHKDLTVNKSHDSDSAISSG